MGIIKDKTEEEKVEQLREELNDIYERYGFTLVKKVVNEDEFKRFSKATNDTIGIFYMKK